MENNKNNIGHFPQMPICDDVLRAEVGNDFTLPEYKSEIRKILSTKVKILPPKKYVGNNGTNLEGELIYKVLYVGADGDPYCATLSDKYRFDADFHFDEHSLNSDELFINSFCECEGVSTHVLGPRKINLKCKLKCRLLVLSPSIYLPEYVGVHDSSCVEERIYECDSLFTMHCESEPVSLSDLIPIDPQIDNIRIIDTNSSVMISECSPVKDCIHVRGEVFFKILYCNDAQGDQPLCFLRRIPFSTTIACDGATNTYDACAHGIITDENVNIDDNSISIELLLAIYADLQMNDSIPYICDAFSTERVTENEKDTLNVLTLVKAFCGNLTQSESYLLSDLKIGSDTRIIDSNAKARIEAIDLENGRTYLNGEICYQLLLFNDGEYTSYELSAPLRYEIDVRSAPNKNTLDLLCAKAEVVSTRSRTDGERIFIDCELNFCVSVLGKDKIKFLSKATFSEKLQKSVGAIRLCYPDKSDSLWDIAKRYGEPVEKIRTKNSISEGNDISKKRFLVI